MDSAFLRRMRYKIYIGYATPNQFMAIFRKVCQEYGLQFDADIVRDMMNRYYVATSSPLSACHPRDLIESLVDRARSWERNRSSPPKNWRTSVRPILSNRRTSTTTTASAP